MLKMRNLIRNFRRNEDGVLMAEAVIVLPMLLWAYLALFVYWDAFRSVNTAQKAAYTISDMISREMITLPTTYVTGMRDVMRYMVDEDRAVRIRVTSIRYSESNSQFEVEWSRSPDSALPELTTANLAETYYASQIPAMADGDSVIIVETEVDYSPAFNVGLTDETQRQFIVTRPRFIPKICMTGVTCA